MFISVLSVGYSLETTERLIFEKNSLYQYISVIEDTAKNERYIRNNKREISQGGIYLNAPDSLLFEYSRISFISLAFLDREPRNVLFVGLGAGAMPRYFNKYYPEANMDIVEIDPDIEMVARKYFYFKENERMKVHLNDGRLFIKRTQKKYDIIFLDAYQNDYIPFHLATMEFLKEVKSRLKEGGVVVSNVLSPFRNKFFDSMVVTYDKVFPQLYIFKGRRSNNFVFIATPKSGIRDKEDISSIAQKIQASKKMDINLGEIGWTCEHCDDYKTNAKVLTDDFAPVNLYKHQKSGAD
jgi:spermidine synthase